MSKENRLPQRIRIFDKVEERENGSQARKGSGREEEMNSPFGL